MNVVGILIITYLVISYILGTIISMTIILENRDPARTVTWLMIFILLPGIGIILYLIFGRNIRKMKMLRTQKLANEIREQDLFKDIKKIDHFIELYSNNQKLDAILESDNKYNSYKKIIKLLMNTGTMPVTSDNEVDIYKDGNEKFTQLLEDIKQAKESIHLEYFIIKDSEIGRQIKNELIKKSKEGIVIRILYDDVGCWRLWFNKKFINDMRSSGIKIEPFIPNKFPIMIGKLNYRNHRKIVVIDGKIGYTGGINIGDEYIGKKEKFGYWRDTHIRIKGSAVNMIQMTFIVDWYYTTKEIISSEQYFPKTDSKKNAMVQIVASGPDSDWEAIHYAYFLAICQAKEKIYIETPYFIPDESLLKALKSAALSGIDVKIIFPKIPDHKIVNSASYSYFGEILRAGGRVYLYEKGFIHSKVIIIDDKIASTGSANMDLRSFMLNFEMNAFIYDKDIINKMDMDFYDDIKNSTELKIEDYEARSIDKKIIESINRLFSPIL